MTPKLSGLKRQARTTTYAASWPVQPGPAGQPRSACVSPSVDQQVNPGRVCLSRGKGGKKYEVLGALVTARTVPLPLHSCNQSGSRRHTQRHTQRHGRRHTLDPFMGGSARSHGRGAGCGAGRCPLVPSPTRLRLPLLLLWDRTSPSTGS